VGRFLIVASEYVAFEASDGRELLRTLPLRNSLACRAAIIGIRLNALLSEAYARADAAPTGCCFVLHAADGSTLAVSPVFASIREREAAIATVRREAPSAHFVHVEAASDIAPNEAIAQGDGAGDGSLTSIGLTRDR
jgi:hypothetical protein